MTKICLYDDIYILSGLNASPICDLILQLHKEQGTVVHDHLCVSMSIRMIVVLFKYLF